jgi:hypothetical protein
MDRLGMDLGRMDRRRMAITRRTEAAGDSEATDMAEGDKRTAPLNHSHSTLFRRLLTSIPHAAGEVVVADADGVSLEDEAREGVVEVAREQQETAPLMERPRLK